MSLPEAERLRRRAGVELARLQRKRDALEVLRGRVRAQEAVVQAMQDRYERSIGWGVD